MIRCMKCMREFDEVNEKCPHCGAEYSSEPLSSRHLNPGTLLNERYIVGYSIDVNSVFVTYIALDKTKNKRVLINEYMPNNLAVRNNSKPEIATRSGDAENKYYAGLRAFKDECTDLINIKHTDVIGGFEENNTFYAVRRIITGTSLAEIIDDDYEITNEYARHVIVTLLKAIEPVHELGIVHGNITPDTIIIDENGTVVITDFGFLGFMSRIMPVYTNEGYSPIEQYKTGSKLTVAVDVYSIAAIYYELITGEIPVSATERENQDTLVPISETEGVTISQSTCNAIMNALNIKAENRTQSVNDFYTEIKGKDTKRHWERHYVPEKTKPDFYRKRNFWLKAIIWTMAGVMLICALVIAYEISSIRKNLNDRKIRESELSTESLPEEGKSIFDIFGDSEETEEETEEVTEKATEKATERTTVKTDTDDRVASGSAVRAE